MYASVALRIPERLRSIPFVVYGSGNNFFPLVGVRGASFDRLQKYSLLGFLLDVVTWTWVIAQVDHPGESVQAVPDGDIKGLAENTVSLLGISNDLRVSSRNVEHNWVLSTSDLSTHLYV